MKYTFKIKIYTDGDFCFPFVPAGMNYDGDYEYKFEKSYKDRDIAIKNIIDICTFLKEEMDTSRDYVREAWNECIDSFIKQLNESTESEYERIDEYIGGNYDGTEFIFHAKPQYIDCGFYVSDEEYNIIKNSDNKITNEMVKEAVINLFRNN